MEIATYQRLNISLPHKTLAKIDCVAVHGMRSRLIDQAVNFYLADMSRTRLREALKKGAIDRADRDKKISAELFEMNDAWGVR